MKKFYVRQSTGQLKCVRCRDLFADKQALGQHYQPDTKGKPCKDA